MVHTFRTQPRRRLQELRHGSMCWNAKYAESWRWLQLVQVVDLWNGRCRRAGQPHPMETEGGSVASVQSIRFNEVSGWQHGQEQRLHWVSATFCGELWWNPVRVKCTAALMWCPLKNNENYLSDHLLNFRFVMFNAVWVWYVCFGIGQLVLKILPWDKESNDQAAVSLSYIYLYIVWWIGFDFWCSVTRLETQFSCLNQAAGLLPGTYKCLDEPPFW